MAQLIDTSVFIELERRQLEIDALRSAVPDEPVALSAITASELLIGVHRADTEARKIRRSAFVERLLEILPIFEFDLNAARVHAKIVAKLMSDGNLISAHDLIIASTALANGFAVLTANIGDFERVPGLDVACPAW